MELQVAEAIARATREEAELQARDDLDQLRRRAVEAGRERSRRVLKITVINTTTGEISYNAAGRLLRDWYLHVYINSLRGNLSQPNEPIDAQQTEETGATLRRVHPAEPHQALKAVEAVRQIAVTDADAAAARITERLRNAGAARAIQHAPDERFDSDELRVHVSRHWYQRCYDDTVDDAVRARHPLAPVTDAEMLEVAHTLATQEARRVIGHDGISLVVAQADAINDLTERLVVGQPDTTASPGVIPHGGALDALTQRVMQAWSDMDQETRTEWLRVSVVPGSPAKSDWFDLDDVQQMKLVQHYVGSHRNDSLGGEPEPLPIEGSASEVARKMFDHSRPLAAVSPTSEREPDPAQLDFDGALTDARSRDLALLSGDRGSGIRQAQ